MLPKLPAAPDTNTFHELPLESWWQWSISQVLGALAAHEQGQFYLSAILCDYLLRDDRVSATLGTRINAMLGLPFQINPGARAHAGKSKKIVRALTEDWSKIISRGQMAEAKRWVCLMGFAIGEIVWNTEGDRWVPEIRIWHPAFAWYDTTRRQYVINTFEGPQWITPGDGKWILFAPHGQYRAWMHGAVRSLPIMVMLRQFGMRDLGRTGEVLGAGLMKCVIPANALPKDVAQFKAQLSKLTSEPRIFLPHYMHKDVEVGFDIEFAGADVAQGAARLFDTTLSRCDAGITLVILGQNLTTEVKEGSLAAARAHGDVRQDYLEFDAVTSKEDLANQAIRPWTLYNFGDVDDAPDAGWDATPEEDKLTKADALQKFGQALVSLTNISCSRQIDIPAMFEAFGIPMLEEDPEIIPDPVSTPAKPDKVAPAQPKSAQAA